MVYLFFLRRHVYLATILTTVSISICGSQKRCIGLAVSHYMVSVSKHFYTKNILLTSSSNCWKAAVGVISSCRVKFHMPINCETFIVICEQIIVISKYRRCHTPHFLPFPALLLTFMVLLPCLFLVLVLALLMILCRAGLNLILLFLFTFC